MAVSSAQIVAKLNEAHELNVERRLLYELLFESLSPRQQDIYLYVRNNPGATSMSIKEQFPQSSQVSVDNELMRLRKLKVLHPTPQTGDGAFHYTWQVTFVLADESL
jgi:hypothetical protein